MKILLIWLLALAIPVQGLASAAQVECASRQKIHTVSSHVGPVPATKHVYLHAAQVLPISTLSRADDPDHAASHQHQPRHQGSSSMCGFCNACNVCAIGVIPLVSLDNAFLLPASADSHLVSVRPSYVSHIPELPERPPSLPV